MIVFDGERWVVGGVAGVGGAGGPEQVGGVDGWVDG